MAPSSSAGWPANGARWARETARDRGGGLAPRLDGPPGHRQPGARRRAVRRAPRLRGHGRYDGQRAAWNGGKDGGEYKRTLKQALDDAHAGKFKVLIVWALDRITREGAEGALRIIRQFRERGCIVVSVKESWLNGSPEIQDVLVAFAGWMAQQESAGAPSASGQGLSAAGPRASLSASTRRRGPQAAAEIRQARAAAHDDEAAAAL